MRLFKNNLMKSGIKFHRAIYLIDCRMVKSRKDVLD